MDDPDYIDLEEVPNEPDLSFPQAGLDRTPTAEMIARGLHGNGAWNLTDGSVQAAYEETHRIKKEMEDDRRDHFQEKAKDALSDAVDLHHRIIRMGQRVMDKLEIEDKVSSNEMKVLSMSQKSSIELTDRATGKAKQQSEHVEKKSTLMFLIEGETT